MSPQDDKNLDLESQDPIFNANQGQDENLIWTKKLRCSHSITMFTLLSKCIENVIALGKMGHFRQSHISPSTYKESWYQEILFVHEHILYK